MEDTSLNVQHLHIVDNGQPLPEEQQISRASQFELSISPFTDLLPVIHKSTSSSPCLTFGFTFQYYDLLKRSFVKTIQPKYPDFKIFFNPRATNKNLRGSFLTSIRGIHVFTSDDALKQLHILNKQGGL